MDVARTILLWEAEGIIVLMVLGSVVLFHYATKVWSSPADAVLGTILGASIGTVCSVLYLTRHLWGFSLSTRAMGFVVLYVWCVCCMLFFAARQTRRSKLFLGLASQAGIIYALFIYL